MSRKVEFVTLEDLHDSKDACLDFDEPPRATVLTVYRGVLPEPGRHRAFGFIQCVDDSGLVLFSSAQGEAAADKHFFVADLRQRSVFRLPAVPPSLPLRLSSDRLGVIHRGGALASDSEYLASDSGVTSWRIRDIQASSTALQDMISRQRPDMVVSHDGNLIFVDPQRGLLFVNPFAVGAEPRFMALPRAVSCESSSAGRAGIGRCRCIGTSAGRLCYVCIHDVAESMAVTVWNMWGGIWERLYKVYLSDILPQSTCRSVSLGFVHPVNPWTVFFFVDETLTGIDMVTMEMVKSCAFDDMGSSSHSSMDLWAWVLPSLDLQPASAIETQTPTRPPRWRRRLRKVISFTKDHPECLITAGQIIEGAARYIPVDFVSLEHMRTGGICIANVLTVAGKGLQWHQEAARHWIQDKEFTGTVTDLETIKTRDEAMKVLDVWTANGRQADGLRVKLSDEISDEDRAELRDIFLENGAGVLLHHTSEIDGSWVFLHM